MFRNFKDIPIKSKLQIAFLVFGLLIILATGWQAYDIGRSALEEVSFNRLTSVRETKKREVETYFERLRSSVVTIAEHPAIHRQAASLLRHPFDSTMRTQSASPGNDSLYSRWLNRFQFHSISLVHAEDDVLLFSTDPVRIAKELHDHGRRKKDVLNIIGAAVGTVPNTQTYITDLHRDDATRNEPVMFISVPVLDGNRLLCVLLVEVGIERINRIMTDDDEWSIRGMGKSGETYIVGPDRLMRTDSRFLTDTPKRYLNALQRYGYKDDVISRIREENTTILYQTVHTDASIAALEGQTGIQIVDDYRGIPVLSSYSPLKIEGLSWVILAEMDTKEAFASVAQLQESLIFIVLVMLLIATISGYILANTIAMPLQQLADASEQFGKGDLDWRVHVDSKDELGHLAEAFNAMAENLKKMTAELQSEVRVRKEAESELHSSHERLRQLSAHQQSVREEERKHLAREIHDELGQSLTALKMDAAMLERRYAGTETAFKERIADMVTLIQDTIVSVKRITAELRPGILDDLGLSAAIEWQAEEFRKRTGIECSLTLSPQSIIVSQDVSTTIFRIFQEALTNVTRHAEASRVEASLVSDGQNIVLHVEDNGKGITAANEETPSTFGILGMRERTNTLDGTFEISNRREGGTRIVVSIPLTAQDANT